MNPSTPSKPVMDIAAPKSPAVAPAAPQVPAPQPAPTATSDLPVRPAPIAQSAPEPQTPTAARRPVASKLAAPNTTPRKPVALITVAVFVMLVLSALAITVYLTSQTA